MTQSLHFVTASKRPRNAAGTMIIGRKKRLKSDMIRRLLPKGMEPLWDEMVERVTTGDTGATTGTYLHGKKLHQVILAALPEPCSRHNSPSRSHAITGLTAYRPKKGPVEIIVALDDDDHALAAACAIARALPLYSQKSGTKKTSSADNKVSVLLVGPNGPLKRIGTIADAAHAARHAGEWVDMPTSELHTDAFVALARETAKKVRARIKVIRGRSLEKQGFGGLWGVGKAATHPPALVVLSHTPGEKAGGSKKKKRKNIVWVGKGIVYDTGGLSLKTKSGMPGMKGDMGGAAAVLAAFSAAVKSGFQDNLYAILCLAENSVGPEATRPDDILHMYSGKSVEVNNTDAEGRLVLADGVAYAAKHLKPTVIVDLATLTGAQLIATGRKHAAIMCNDDALEKTAVIAGRTSGDLVHPLPYCPEFFRAEFKSKVADMKNSVKDRMNAQSSCAGQFIGNHLGKYKGPWLHVDIAGPSTSRERGTGYGVALLLRLFEVV